MLTPQDREDIKDIVVDVIQDTIMPAFEVLATKSELRDGLKGVTVRLDRVEDRLDNLDRKFDRLAADQLDIKYEQNQQEKRLEAVEQVPSVALV